MNSCKRRERKIIEAAKKRSPVEIEVYGSTFRGGTSGFHFNGFHYQLAQ